MLPRGPISRPTKLISGWSSCGMNTLSTIFVAGALKIRKFGLVGFVFVNILFFFKLAQAV